MRRFPLVWMSLASLAVAVGLYGCETPEAFHIAGDGSLLASGTGGFDVTPAGGAVGTGGLPASGGVTGTGGFMLATGGTTVLATGGAGGRLSTGGAAGGHAGNGSGSGGTAGHGTGGVPATGGTPAGGSVGSGGRAMGGSVGSGGVTPGTGGVGGHGAAGGSPGVGGSAGGSVGTGPCAGLCTPATDFKFSSNTTYSSPNLGTTAICYQVTTALTISGGGCSNCTVSSPARTVKINGTTVPNNGNWSNLPAKVNGGYCIQITAGAPDYTTFYTF